ncbi:MAG: hypothetical protein AMXMBFR79_18920 [Chitinophagaceae bacterium]
MKKIIVRLFLLIAIFLYSLYVLVDAVSNKGSTLRIVFAISGLVVFSFLLAVFVRKSLIRNK